MKIVTFCSLKGGTGKTTLSINIGGNIAQLSKKNRKVLLVDLDSQANLTSGLGVDGFVEDIEVKKGKQSLIRKTKIKNLDVLPMSLCMDKFRYAEFDYLSELLHKTLCSLDKSYDLCIIDTPPTIGTVVREAFIASDHIVACLTPEPFSILGLQKIKEISRDIKKNQRNNWLLGIVFSFWDPRNATNSVYIDAVQSIYKNKLFNHKIRRDVHISRSLLKETSVMNAYPKARSSQDFISLSTEIERKLFSKK